ncbi:hypothetical protein AMELA_G00115700 [Ameiurus melas]|uniref:DUF7030 domain-containing protein n=1 Tax=Ameiurus melas TaxID=219545 RepID=A0A7J6AR74_AMEME|nr:hypothetical protein AMELA_G00115700 [Ameiurus melas]
MAAAAAAVVEARPELVGKRFLCVSGEAPPELAEIARWPWRAGVIRAVSHRDTDNPELTHHTTYTACATAGFGSTEIDMRCTGKHVSLRCEVDLVDLSGRSTCRLETRTVSGRSDSSGRRRTERGRAIVHAVCVYSVPLVCFQGCGLRSAAFMVISRNPGTGTNFPCWMGKLERCSCALWQSVLLNQRYD